jgi:cytochrome d ubiquinol oxidase subunit I
MELDSFTSVLLNPDAQDKFFHTVCAGYVTASVFVLAISSFYLLKKQDVPFARRSFKVASLFGFFATIALLILGDSSGLTVARMQPAKLAAIEGIWNTQKAPIGWSVIAWPDQQAHKNTFDLQIPYLGSIILTHSLTIPVQGANNIIAANKERIRDGQLAVELLNQLKAHPKDTALLQQFEVHEKNLGYGLLLKKYTDNVALATPEMVDKAANDTVPDFLPLFYSFRIMVALGISFFVLFGLSWILFMGGKQVFEKNQWFFRWALLWLPMPWIACWCGWTVAEYGRQPWTIYEILPTYLSASSLSTGELAFSLTGFVVIYTLLAIVEIWLIVKYAKLGPSSLGTGKYHFEQQEALSMSGIKGQ